jgi:hypothetical protein
MAWTYTSSVSCFFTQKFGFSVPGASVHVPSMMRLYACATSPASTSLAGVLDSAGLLDRAEGDCFPVRDEASLPHPTARTATPRTT